MVGYDRRTLLKGGAAFAGASALGFPAIVRWMCGETNLSKEKTTATLGPIHASAATALVMTKSVLNFVFRARFRSGPQN